MKTLVKILLLCAVALVSWTMCAGATTVIVAGSGPTVDAALRDCMRTAVEQTVGVYVDAKTLVEKNVVLQDSIYANSRGFVRNYKILSSIQAASGYNLTAEIDVDSDANSQLMSSLQKLQIIQVGLNNPRIAVLVNDGAYSNPVTESAIESILGDEGFRIVTTAIRNKDALRNTVVTISSNDVARFTKSFDANSVDYLILGVTNVKNAGDIANVGMYTGKGSGSFKIIRVDTGDIIASNNFSGIAADISGEAAVDKACEIIGINAANFVKTKLLNYAANPNKSVQLTLTGVADFASLQKFQAAIAALVGVSSTQINKFSADAATMTISGSISALDLATYINADLPQYTVLSVTNAAISLMQK
ncbi:MAG: hypothetical protein WCP79_08845 [Bacillota bacterium]